MCLGIPGELLEVREEEGLRLGRVRFGGVVREVCLACEPDAVPGDFVVVHVGFAIARLDRAEAERTFELLAELGRLEALENEDGNENRGGLAIPR